MKLITYYVVLSLIGDVAAVALCLGIEKVVPWISMPIFLSLFFLILWGAWVARREADRAEGAIRTAWRCNERPASLNRRPSRVRWNDGEAGAQPASPAGPSGMRSLLVQANAGIPQIDFNARKGPVRDAFGPDTLVYP